MTAATSAKPPITHPRIAEINRDMMTLYQRVKESQTGPAPIDPVAFMALSTRYPAWRSDVEQAEALLTAARALVEPAAPQNLALSDLPAPPEPIPTQDTGEADTAGEINSEDENSPTPQAAEDATEETDATPDAQTAVFTADLQPGTGRLFGQLAGLLGDGDTVTLTVTRLAGELRVMVVPHASSGETTAGIVAFQVQASAQTLDAEFDFALQPYAEARRDVITLAREAAAKTRDAAKTTSKPSGTPAKPAAGKPAKVDKAKAHLNGTLALTVRPQHAAVSALDSSGTAHPLTAGPNSLAPGKYKVTASLPGHADVSGWVTVTASHQVKFDATLKPSAPEEVSLGL